MQLGKVLYRGRRRVVAPGGEELLVLPRPARGGLRLSEILHAKNPLKTAERLARRGKPLGEDEFTWLPPICKQEVWGAGVTYQRSESARKDESQGAAVFYHAVYRAERPELFFKASPHRVVGHRQAIRIRADSKWNLPEPELTLVINPRLEIVGYTIGNDVSSRDIEGENPLYLPQAKVYDGCCALGPAITLAEPGLDPHAWKIGLSIIRNGNVCFEGTTSVSQMARELPDLVSWLGRECSFPEGCFLLTGTGVVPPVEFTLQSGDVVEIGIGELGRLVNGVG